MTASGRGRGMFRRGEREQPRPPRPPAPARHRPRPRAHAPSRRRPARDAAAAELLATVRSQLDVDEERAAEVERLVRLVEAAIARTAADKGMGAAGPGVLFLLCLVCSKAWSGLWRPRSRAPRRTRMRADGFSRGALGRKLSPRVPGARGAGLHGSWRRRGAACGAVGLLAAGRPPLRLAALRAAAAVRAGGPLRRPRAAV